MEIKCRILALFAKFCISKALFILLCPDKKINVPNTVSFGQSINRLILSFISDPDLFSLIDLAACVTDSFGSIQVLD